MPLSPLFSIFLPIAEIHIHCIWPFSPILSVLLYRSYSFVLFSLFPLLSNPVSSI